MRNDARQTLVNYYVTFHRMVKGQPGWVEGHVDGPTCGEKADHLLAWLYTEGYIIAPHGGEAA